MFSLLVCTLTLVQGTRWALELAPGTDPRAFAAARNLTYVGPTPLEHHYVFQGDHARHGRDVAWAEQQVPRKLYRRLFTNSYGVCTVVQRTNTKRYTRTQDPAWPQSWHLHDWEGDVGLQVERVWNETTGRGVVVAIVDDGLQWSHPDLFERYQRLSLTC